ncbi:MAG: hypothetical protein H0W62_11190 [Chitinophagales bacterium]|nr:hypothetical protein [Chitinophagales bacterium]
MKYYKASNTIGIILEIKALKATMKEKINFFLIATLMTVLLSSCFVRVHGRRSHVVVHDRDLINPGDDGTRSGFINPKPSINSWQVMQNTLSQLHSTF